MAKRITIMLDDDIDKKLRLQQSKLILNKNKSISFSAVINHYLENGLKNNKKKYSIL